jgi:hypothetical protein
MGICVCPATSQEEASSPRLAESASSRAHSDRLSGVPSARDVAALVAPRSPQAARVRFRDRPATRSVRPPTSCPRTTHGCISGPNRLRARRHRAQSHYKGSVRERRPPWPLRNTVATNWSFCRRFVTSSQMRSERAAVTSIRSTALADLSIRKSNATTHSFCNMQSNLVCRNSRSST